MTIPVWGIPLAITVLIWVVWHGSSRRALERIHVGRGQRGNESRMTSIEAQAPAAHGNQGEQAPLVKPPTPPVGEDK